MKRTFVTTDIHGEDQKFKSLLEQVDFDYKKDRMINLGDCVDRGPDSYEVVERLLKIDDLISIRGNHDDWFNTAIHTGVHPAPAYFQECRHSYTFNGTFKVPQRHMDFFAKQLIYYIDNENRFFCHAGYLREELVEIQDEQEFFWNRDLFKQARSCAPGVRLNDVNGFHEVFIGHSPTINYKEGGKRITTPIQAAQVINLDTGACFGGKLSMLDITDLNDYKLYQS